MINLKPFKLLHTSKPVYYKLYVLIQSIISVLQVCVYFGIIQDVPDYVRIWNAYILLVIGVIFVILYNPFYNIRTLLKGKLYNPFLYAIHFYVGNLIVFQYLSMSMTTT